MQARQPSQLRTFLRIGQVLASTGLSRSMLYFLMSQGEFPKPVKIGPRAVAWDSETVAIWQSSRIDAARVGQ